MDIVRLFEILNKPDGYRADKSLQVSLRGLRRSNKAQEGFKKNVKIEYTSHTNKDFYGTFM